jgi:glycerol kinase
MEQVSLWVAIVLHSALLQCNFIARETGKAYHNAIVWSDGRTAEACERLQQTNSGATELVRSRAGLPIAPYFSGGKLKHLLDVVPGLRADAQRGLALFGTIDSYLVWKLTSGKEHCTDVTNASRTMLMSLRSLAWDDDLLDLFQVPRVMLPRIQPSVSLFGEVTAVQAIRGCKITGVLGDQQGMGILRSRVCKNYVTPIL